MLDRYITKLIVSSLNDFPAILLIGARQVGKSTIAEFVENSGLIDAYVTLDNLSQLEAANSDPEGFIASLPSRVAIDEIQRSPNLLRSIKKAIDTDRENKKFLLTGSANVLAYDSVPESLGGRVDVINLEGLMLAELNKKPKFFNLVKIFFNNANTHDLRDNLEQVLNNSFLLNKQILAEKVFFGGFPEVAIKSKLTFAERWFAAYQTTYIERDAHNISKNIDAINFNKTLQICNFNTGQLTVLNNLSNNIGIDHRTLQRYLNILKLTYQITFLEPWYVNAKKRLIKTSKIYSLDSGMSTFLNGIASPDDLLKHKTFGALAETWIFAELRKIISLNSGFKINFYRTQTGKEVDFIISRGEKCFGIELKLANTVNSKDFKGLQDWLEISNNNYMGIILYTGDEFIALNEKLAAVPIKILS